MKVQHPSVFIKIVIVIIAVVTFSGTGYSCPEHVVDDEILTVQNKECIQWQPLELAFHSDINHENPFLVELKAIARGPGDLELDLLGYYDGNGLWKIRFLPLTTGKWEITTSSEDVELNELTVRLECLPNPDQDQMGILGIHPDYPHRFAYDRDHIPFIMGHECDWLWALDMFEETPEKLYSYLDKLKSYGFNYVVMNVFAYDTGWRWGKTEKDDLGPPEMFPWQTNHVQGPPAQINNAMDHTRFNIPFWQHYDRVVEALMERGMTAHMMIKVMNKYVPWPLQYSKGDDMYWKYIVARYAGFPNVVWDFGKEAYNERDINYKLLRLGHVKQWDPYNHLVTIHDDMFKDESPLDPAVSYKAHHHKHVYTQDVYDETIDFFADQYKGSYRYHILREQYQRRSWPVMNIEPGYEHGPGGPDDKTFGDAQTPEEMLRRAMEITMAGGYFNYYYTYSAWDVIRTHETPAGYKYFKNLSDIFSSIPFWKLEPVAEQQENGVWIAGPVYRMRGSEENFLFYRPEGGDFELTGLTELAEKASLYNLFSGEKRSLKGLKPGRPVKCPSEWLGDPVILYIYR